MRRLCSVLAIGLLCAAPAAALDIDWVFVGLPGNARDVNPTRDGDVDGVYYMGKYEVTNAQYAGFLNAVAATDTFGLYDERMGDPDSFQGGIARDGLSGSYSYSVIPGRGQRPVNFVGYFDGLRFANWLHNDQPSGPQDASTSEDGAYTFTPQGIEDNSITRNPGARFFIPNPDEWYKAAYHDAAGLEEDDYFDYPAGTDVQTTCSTPPGGTNHANCFREVGGLTPVGAYPDSASPWGTFDQGGNVWEWIESPNTDFPVLRGSEFEFDADALASSQERSGRTNTAEDGVGLRVAAAVPIVATGPAGVTDAVAVETHGGSASDWYGGDESGQFVDYDGVAPIEKADLLSDAAHLFLVDTTDGLTLFVVYEAADSGGTRRAAGSLGGPVDFVIEDILVRDAAIDDYDIVDGAIDTDHGIPINGRSDGYAALVETQLVSEGDTLTLELISPSPGSGAAALASVQVYVGEVAGEPVWFELASGSFASGVVVTLPEPDAAASLLVGALALTGLAHRGRRR